jgi:ribose transport system substrate-binding protein
MRVRKVFAAAAGAALLAVSVTACGSSSSDGGKGASATATATATASSGSAGAPADPLANVDWRSLKGPRSKATVKGDTVTVDVGGGKTVTQKKSDPLRIAYFSQGTTNEYLQAQIKGAKDMAKKLGASITVFDGGFNVQTVKAQMQNALASHKYNAFVGIFVDSDSACQPMSEAAPKQNILVVQIVQPICGRGAETGQGLWAPGTLASVDGGGSLDFYRAWALNAAKAVTKPTKVAYLSGPAVITSTKAATQALREAEQKYPNFQLVEIKNTDFSSAQGLSMTQNLLVSHPDLGIIMSHFTPLTTGVLQALSQAGKKGKVAVYDAGTSKIDVNYVKSGGLTASAAYWPYTDAACAVDMVAAAHSGESVPRSVQNDCRKVGGQTAETPYFLTKDNVSDFKPEY